MVSTTVLHSRRKEGLTITAHHTSCPAAAAASDVEAKKRYQEKRAAEKAGEPTFACCRLLITHHTLCRPQAAAAACFHSDVEAEKRYQEKRAAEKAGEPLPPPPVVLWRSARELGVWVKDLRRARTTGALGGAAYAAAALVDRAHVSGMLSALSAAHNSCIVCWLLVPAVHRLRFFSCTGA
jgi:hypothetical protein